MCLSWFTDADFELFCRLQSELERRMTAREVFMVEPWEIFLTDDPIVFKYWDEIDLQDGGWYCAIHLYCHVSTVLYICTAMCVEPMTSSC